MFFWLFPFNCFNLSMLLYKHVSCCSDGYIGYCSLQYHACVIASLVDRPELPSPHLPGAMPVLWTWPTASSLLVRAPTLIWFAIFICVCLTTQDKFFGSLGSLRLAPYMMCPLMSFSGFSLEFQVLPAHPHQSEFLVYVDSNFKVLYIPWSPVNIVMVSFKQNLIFKSILLYLNL